MRELNESEASELDEMMKMINCENPEESDFDYITYLSVIIEGYVSISISSVGIIANILAIIIFSRKMLQNNFTNLLIALACFDILFLLFSIADMIRKTFQDEVGNSETLWGSVTKIHHHLFPVFLYPLHNILLSCSILMTISVSVERYLVLNYPLGNCNRKNSRCCVMTFHILPVIILSILINIPKFLDTQTGIDGDVTFITVTELRKSYEYSLYYVHWFRFIFIGLGPFSVLLWLNAKIYFQISRMSGLKQERNYSIILLLIVVMFLICHSPRLFLNVYEAVEFHYVAQCGSPPIWIYKLTIVSHLLIFINSSTNILIYLVAIPQFRKSILSLCKNEENEQNFFNEKTEVDTCTLELREVEQTKLLMK